MDSRRTKQLIYGGIFVIVVCLIVYGAYALFLKPAPSCFDHVQDGGETGVDCGGPCAKVCTPSTLQGITAVGGVQSFVTSLGHYTFLAQIANANTDFGARSVGYSIDLYGGASSTLIASIPGQSFIYGGEVKYLLVPNLLVSTPFTNASLTIMNANIAWITSSTMGGVPQFVVQNLGPGPLSSSTVSVNGELTDNDASAFSNILIVGVFKDVNGNVIGASQTELDGIAPNQTETFSVSYPVTPDIDPSLTELYAYALR